MSSSSNSICIRKVNYCPKVKLLSSPFILLNITLRIVLIPAFLFLQLIQICLKEKYIKHWNNYDFYLELSRFHYNATWLLFLNLLQITKKCHFPTGRSFSPRVSCGVDRRKEMKACYCWVKLFCQEPSTQPIYECQNEIHSFLNF